MKTFVFPEKLRKLTGNDIDLSELARVIAEHRERYQVQSSDGIFQAEITGNIRFAAQTRADFPAVGDWVRIMKMDESTAIIVGVLPRFSQLSRLAVHSSSETQLIASNIDVAFIVQSVGHDFNLNRMERYLSICYSSSIEPVMLLTKIDLIPDTELDDLKQKIHNRLPAISVIPVSSTTGEGYESLEKLLKASETYCFLGSSGVGKSTIINRLLMEEAMKTAEISVSTSKGRHTTSHRELFYLPNGSMVIDTPGMRELGMTDQSDGIEKTYAGISELAENCRYRDCTHTGEKGCAVLKAVDDGDLSVEVYENYLKLKREQERFSTSVHEKKQMGKIFGKMVKEANRERKRNKF